MSVSIFDLFAIGIGPSSSHTMGPMSASFDFVSNLKLLNFIESTHRVQVILYGSLAWTGKGHHTDVAILMGLEGFEPDTVDPDFMVKRPGEIKQSSQLRLANAKHIKFNPSEDIVFNLKKNLEHHVNGMRCLAYDSEDNIVSEECYYSIGGGFIVSDSQLKSKTTTQSIKSVRFPYSSADELLNHCTTNHLSISDIVLANERSYHDLETIDLKLQNIWLTMQSCIDRGYRTLGTMPGDLKVKRRAPSVYDKLTTQESIDPMLWLNLYALAVNEENGSGGRIVTAPTNGAAGIIPAVLKYFVEFHGAGFEEVKKFLLTAGGIALLYKLGASISGAEVGCQGEVGVACSMAAGALCEVLGGDIWQVENAAEIGMEHHLGLTCDPIGGLVQIPCIERNAMAAVKAVNAAKLALLEEGRNHVSLDQVIRTMKKTGEDMHDSYKETSRGGLAVVYPEC